MATSLGTLQEICNLAAKQVQDMYPNVELLFIPHEMGHFHEVVELGDYGVIQHAAGKIARSILEKNKHRELSSFLGLAINHQVKWLGLASSENILGLININTGEFDTSKDLRRAVYHQVWHAMDLIEIRQIPEYKSKFRSGPMVPKRSPMNLARLNLQADVFSAVMSGLQGEDNAIDVLAAQRAMDSIRPVHARRAEDYPFVIAMESAKYGFERLIAQKPQRSQFMAYARQLAQEVGYTFDENSIRQWWGFSEPAQDMAWRNQPGEVILGSAVVTSENSFVRATGHLVCDITGIRPDEKPTLGRYNSFATMEQNKVLHREVMERTFEEAMEQGLHEESGEPLIAAANKQNEILTEGLIIGWCANALHAAARAFESARKTGRSPHQAAKLEFEGSKDSASFDALEKIGDAIVDKKRKGFAVTMGTVAEICDGKADLAPVMNAVVTTMKDQGYIKKLEMANALSPVQPSSPAPKGPAPVTPAPKAAPATPTYIAAPPMGMGLGGVSNVAARNRAMAEEMRRRKSDEETTTK